MENNAKKPYNFLKLMTKWDIRKYENLNSSKSIIKLYKLYILLLFTLPLWIPAYLSFDKADLFISSEFPYIFSENPRFIIAGLVAMLPAILGIGIIVKNTIKGVFNREIYIASFLELLDAVISLFFISIVLAIICGALFLTESVGTKALKIYKKIGSCEEWANVISVGGCDMLGNCSAYTSSGKINLDKPVKGELVCFKKIGIIDALK